MTSEMNNRLAVLAAEMRDEWSEIEIQFGMNFGRMMKFARKLWEARQLFPSDPLFGEWLRDNKLNDAPSADDRAGLILMAQHPDAAIDALSVGKTSARSIGKYIREELERRSLLSQPCDSSPVESTPVEVIETPPQPEPEPIPVEPAEENPVATESDEPDEPAGRPSRLLVKYVKALGEEQGRALLERLAPGTIKAHLQYLVGKVLAAHGGREAVRELAEVLAAHPHWTPSPGTSAHLTARALNSSFGGGKNASGWPPTAHGLRRTIKDALELEARASLPPVHERAAPRPTNVVTISPKIVPLDDIMKLSAGNGTVEFGKPFESPREDEDIAVFGTVIRHKGEKPEFYQRVWSMMRYMEMFDFYVERGDPNPASRGKGYHQMGHFFRDAHGATMETYWHAFATAVEKMVDRKAGIQMSHRTYRIKA